MKRRNFIKAAATSGLVTSTYLSPSTVLAKPNSTIKWKMVTTWPKNFPGLGSGANNLARLITEMSGGRIKVKVYGAKELVPAFEVFDAVSRGTAQMGHGAAYYWKGKNRCCAIFCCRSIWFNRAGNEWLALSWWRVRTLA